MRSMKLAKEYPNKITNRSNDRWPLSRINNQRYPQPHHLRSRRRHRPWVLFLNIICIYIYVNIKVYVYIYKHYYIYIYHYIPTCELIHPLPKVLVKMNFLCPRCDRWYLIYNLKSVVCFEMCWIFVVSFWRGVLFKSFRGVLKLCVPMIPILPLHSIICRHTSLHVRYLPFPLWLHPFEV